MCIGIDHIPGGKCLVLVHAHIQTCIFPVGKPAGPVIKLRARHPEIHQDAVHFPDAERIQHGIQFVKGGMNARKSVTDRFKTRCTLVDRFLIHVEGIEMPRFQTAQDLAAVTPSSQRAVHVYAVRLHIQQIDCLIQ